MIPDKYKVGDYVYVQRGLRVGIREDGLYVCPRMTELGSKKMQIEKVLTRDDRYRLYGLDYSFASDMLHRTPILQSMSDLTKNPLPKL